MYHHRCSGLAVGADSSLGWTSPIRAPSWISWRASTLILPDVNVLVNASRDDAPRHLEYRKWLESIVRSPQPFGLSELVLSGVVRVVTHPRIFATPTPIDDALAFVTTLRGHPNAVVIAPGVRHFDLFRQLCTAARTTGNLVADAYLAALAIESGSEWITDDRDFARFSGLRWRHPLDD